ncbi:hypothetical protein RhiirC2_749222 [Rhizophagus irregularis]|uniref:Uncharacterized protein n=1 Tax=Rhizophagus irregularis TaxID=588596 RepID=A0A2N1N553_9GLOM|nr:hypothetical protein RhiirC2_749222 [Rhizophagus irregularis]
MESRHLFNTVIMVITVTTVITVITTTLRQYYNLNGKLVMPLYFKFVYQFDKQRYDTTK